MKKMFHALVFHRNKHLNLKFCATVIVLGGVSDKGDVTVLHTFPMGLRVITDEYLEIIKAVVIPWMDQVARIQHYIILEDSAPAHNSKKTQGCLKGTVA